MGEGKPPLSTRSLVTTTTNEKKTVCFAFSAPFFCFTGNGSRSFFSFVKVIFIIIKRIQASCASNPAPIDARAAASLSASSIAAFFAASAAAARSAARSVMTGMG